MSAFLDQLAKAGGANTPLALRLADGRLTGTLADDEDARDVDVGITWLDEHALLLEHGGRRVRAWVAREGDRTWVCIGGATVEVDWVEPGSEGDAEQAGGDTALSPMTGTVVKVDAEAGATVETGDALLVVEAMKMEYVVRSPRAGVVAEVTAAAGDRVDADQVLVRLEPVT